MYWLSHTSRNAIKAMIIIRPPVLVQQQGNTPEDDDGGRRPSTPIIRTLHPVNAYIQFCGCQNCLCLNLTNIAAAVAAALPIVIRRMESLCRFVWKVSFVV